MLGVRLGEDVVATCGRVSAAVDEGDLTSGVRARFAGQPGQEIVGALAGEGPCSGIGTVSRSAARLSGSSSWVWVIAMMTMPGPTAFTGMPALAYSGAIAALRTQREVARLEGA